jgi:hypothetical protein
MSSPSIPRTPKFLADLIENGGKPARAGFLGLFRSEPKVWAPQAALWAFTLLLVVAHQGSILTYAFPVLAILVGVWLYFKSPENYVAFVWWLWFLSPEVRRLADYGKGGFTPTSIVQIAPLIVTMISAITVVRHFRVLAERRGVPILLIFLGLVYAYLIGVMANGPLAATYDLTNWLYPVLIGFQIMVNAHDYPKYRQAILDTFIWGMLVMGGYGLAQFFLMPAWDAMWMIGSQMASQGDPVRLGVRVFSTMNSSGPFALAMMAALTFTMASTQAVRFLAGGVGFISFGLTMVRSTWGGWVIAMVLQLLKASNKVRVRIVIGAVVLVGLSVPLLTFGPIADKMGQRLSSITNLNDDNSYAARNAFYASFAETAFTDVSGEGFGATGSSTKLSSSNGDLGKYGSFDSGVMNVPFVLGWPGSLMYLAGLGLLLVRAFRASLSLRDDKYAQASLSVAFAILGMLVFTNTFVGTGGVLLFMGLCSVLAARHHAREQHRREVIRFAQSIPRGTNR